MSEEQYRTVADIPNRDDIVLITGSYERNHILEHIGLDPEDYSHTGLFVRVGDGEYTDVWCFGGNVPYLTKSVEKIY